MSDRKLDRVWTIENYRCLPEDSLGEKGFVLLETVDLAGALLKTRKPQHNIPQLRTTRAPLTAQSSIWRVS